MAPMKVRNFVSLSPTSARLSTARLRPTAGTIAPRHWAPTRTMRGIIRLRGSTRPSCWARRPSPRSSPALERVSAGRARRGAGRRIPGPSGRRRSGPGGSGVDAALDARPERVEERGDEQRGCRDRDSLVVDERAHLRDEGDVDDREDREQDDRHEPVADRVADDPVDVVEAIAQDRDADRDRGEEQRQDPGAPATELTVSFTEHQQLTRNRATVTATAFAANQSDLGPVGRPPPCGTA